LLYDIEVVMLATNNKTRFSMFYTLIKQGFLKNQKCVRVTCLLIRLFGEGKLCEHWNLEQFFPRGIRSKGLTEKNFLR